MARPSAFLFWLLRETSGEEQSKKKVIKWNDLLMELENVAGNSWAIATSYRGTCQDSHREDEEHGNRSNVLCSPGSIEVGLELCQPVMAFSPSIRLSP